MVQTEALLTDLKILPRDGEILRFAMEEWFSTHNMITHMLVAANGDPARCTKYIVTASSDDSVRVWDAHHGCLLTVLHVPIVNSRVDALCHCGGTFLLVGVMRHVRMHGNTEPDSEKRRVYRQLDLEVPREYFCWRRAYRDDRLKSHKRCCCSECAPEIDEFVNEVLLWNWTQKGTSVVLASPDGVHRIRHPSTDPEILRGTTAFNSVFQYVPVSIGTILCITPFRDGVCSWACGAGEVTFYETCVGLDEQPTAVKVTTTGPFQKFTPSCCSVNVEHLAWLRKTEILVVGLRGGADLSNGLSGTSEEDVDAVDFEGAILFFAFTAESTLRFHGVLRERASILKTVDIGKWVKYNFDDEIYFDWNDREARDRRDEEEALLRDPAERKRREREERRCLETANYKSYPRPKLTARVFGIHASADEKFVFLCLPKTPQAYQAPRIAGPAVKHVMGRSPEAVIGPVDAETHQDLCNLLLVQVSVGECFVLRVVEVPSSVPHYAHLLENAFDYDSDLDIFIVGSQVVRNPFPSLQQWDGTLVSPVHTKRANTTWQNQIWEKDHPHPQANAFKTLARVGVGRPYVLPSFARFIKFNEQLTQIATATQLSTLYLGCEDTGTCVFPKKCLSEIRRNTTRNPEENLILQVAFWEFSGRGF